MIVKKLLLTDTIIPFFHFDEGNHRWNKTSSNRNRANAIVLDYSLFGQEAAESNVPLAIRA